MDDSTLDSVGVARLHIDTALDLAERHRGKPVSDSEAAVIKLHNLAIPQEAAKRFFYSA